MIAFVVFLAIEGAFNSTSYDSMRESLARHGVDHITVRLIRATLKGPLATATIGGFSRNFALSSASHRYWSYHLSYGALLMKC